MSVRACTWVPDVCTFVYACMCKCQQSVYLVCVLMRLCPLLQCLDFAVTVGIIHIVISMVYVGFPWSWWWWGTNVVGVAIMTVAGEYLCMRSELALIPLSGASTKQSPHHCILPLNCTPPHAIDRPMLIHHVLTVIAQLYIYMYIHYNVCVLCIMNVVYVCTFCIIVYNL